MSVSHGAMEEVLLFAPGSPAEEAHRGVRDLAAKIAAAAPYRCCAPPFGRAGSPTFSPGSGKLPRPDSKA